ncbi:type VI secretion system lipoprotein TssJ [Inquilinus limosus]|uniref:type VI secretion system lipoprotein TssJ n=1 Tax=Inquilinus limosus TaxID=171674 RepID=UPI003F1747E0
MKGSGLIIAALAALVLSGCATAKAIGDAVDSTLGTAPGSTPVTVAAASSANPDASGRPSPIQVQVYQLRSGAALEQADYFKLAENPQAALGESLVGSEQTVVAPGKSQTLSLKLDPATRLIGVAAGFRDIDRARWRAMAPVDPDSSDPIRISVGAADVSVKVED